MTSVIALIVFALSAFILLPQALRLRSEAVRLPPRAQAGHFTIARASWIAGGVAVLGLVLNVAALIGVRRRRLIVPVLLLATSVTAFIVVGIVFKPK